MNGSINNGTAISNTCNSIASAPNNAGFVDCHSTAVAAAFVNGINFREDIVAANGYVISSVQIGLHFSQNSLDEL